MKIEVDSIQSVSADSKRERKRIGQHTSKQDFSAAQWGRKGSGEEGTF